MVEDSILSWNVPNWITVVLMAFTGYLIWQVAMRAVSKKVSGDAAA